MMKLFTMMVSMVLILTVAVSPVWAIGDMVRSGKAAGPAGETGDGDGQASRGTPVGESAQLLSVQGELTGRKGPFLGTLTDAEIIDIKYMREEEKLARDVYRTLYDIWYEPIFDNISKSEQRHMDAVKRLIDKYGLEDPAIDDTVGAFTNPYFADLFDELVELGKAGYCEALKVGIDIENLDIEDIEETLNDVTARDVSRVFNNLLNGSYNHLNAFDSRYKANNCE